MRYWFFYVIAAFVLGFGAAVAVVWHPTTVVVADGGAEIRYYERRLTPAEEEDLGHHFANAPREGWLLWSSVADPLTAVLTKTHQQGRWVPLQMHSTMEGCVAAQHHLRGHILAMQDPAFARWLPFTDCVKLGEHPDDSNPLSRANY